MRPDAVAPYDDKGIPESAAVEAHGLLRRPGDPATGVVETDGWPGPIDEPPPLLA